MAAAEFIPAFVSFLPGKNAYIVSIIHIPGKLMAFK
jgi:hypothetical protein